MPQLCAFSNNSCGLAQPRNQPASLSLRLTANSISKHLLIKPLPRYDNSFSSEFQQIQAFYTYYILHASFPIYKCKASSKECYGISFCHVVKPQFLQTHCIRRTMEYTKCTIADYQGVVSTTRKDDSLATL